MAGVADTMFVFDYTESHLVFTPEFVKPMDVTYSLV